MRCEVGHSRTVRLILRAKTVAQLPLFQRHQSEHPGHHHKCCDIARQVIRKHCRCDGGHHCLRVPGVSHAGVNAFGEQADAMRRGIKFRNADQDAFLQFPRNAYPQHNRSQEQRYRRDNAKRIRAELDRKNCLPLGNDGGCQEEDQ